MYKLLFLITICFCSTFQVTAQKSRIDGKIIKDFGQTFKVENLDIKTDTTVTFKVIFDVSKTT